MNAPLTGEPVLELCRWVVAQPYEIPGRDPNSFDDHKDPHWGWSFKAVADLLQIGLAKGEALISLFVPFERLEDDRGTN